MQRSPLPPKRRRIPYEPVGEWGPDVVGARSVHLETEHQRRDRNNPIEGVTDVPSEVLRPKETLA